MNREKQLKMLNVERCSQMFLIKNLNDHIENLVELKEKPSLRSILKGDLEWVGGGDTVILELSKYQP